MSNESKKTLMPWQNKDGSFKSTKEIKILCRTWSSNVWEEYLKTLEVRQKELPLASAEISEELSNEKYGNLFAKLIGESKNQHLATVAKASLETLSRDQKQIILSLYWEEKSIAQIARELNFSRATVRSYRDRALNHLGSLLISGAVERSLKLSKALEEQVAN